MAWDNDGIPVVIIMAGAPWGPLTGRADQQVTAASWPLPESRGSGEALTDGHATTRGPGGTLTLAGFCWHTNRLRQSDWLPIPVIER